MSDYTTEQLAEWAGQDDEQRYQLLLALASKQKALWTLADEQGCLMIAEQDGQYLPLWPLESFARDAAIEEWQSMTPLEIKLTDWHEKWAPGMIDDGYDVAVFPNNEGECTVVAPEELSVELKLEAKKAPSV